MKCCSLKCSIYDVTSIYTIHTLFVQSVLFIWPLFLSCRLGLEAPLVWRPVVYWICWTPRAMPLSETWLVLFNKHHMYIIVTFLLIIVVIASIITSNTINADWSLRFFAVGTDLCFKAAVEADDEWIVSESQDVTFGKHLFHLIAKYEVVLQ